MKKTNLAFTFCVYLQSKKLCHSYFFPLLISFSRQTAKTFWANILTLVIKKACEQDLTHSLDTPKNIFIKIVSEVVIIRDTCGTWGLMHGNEYSQHSKKAHKKSQKLGNKLASRWLKIHGSKQKEIELISTKV